MRTLHGAAATGASLAVVATLLMGGVPAAAQTGEHHAASRAGAVTAALATDVDVNDGPGRADPADDNGASPSEDGAGDVAKDGDLLANATCSWNGICTWTKAPWPNPNDATWRQAVWCWRFTLPGPHYYGPYGWLGAKRMFSEHKNFQSVEVWKDTTCFYVW